MSPQQLKRIHIALDQTKGKVSTAAGLLGLTVGALRDIIADHPELKSYSADAQPPTPAELVTRPPLVEAAPSETELLEAHAKATVQLRSGFESIGVKPGSLNQAVSFHAFGKAHFRDMRHFIGGGIAKLYADLFSEREDVLKEIASAILAKDVDRERLLREDHGRITDAIIKVYDRCLEAWRLQAAVDAAKAAKNQPKAKAQPAFAPLAMQVNGNVSVNPALTSRQMPDPPED
jgi:hypothetical protein